MNQTRENTTTQSIRSSQRCSNSVIEENGSSIWPQATSSLCWSNLNELFRRSCFNRAGRTQSLCLSSFSFSRASMPAIAESPLFTAHCDDLALFAPAHGSSYVYASSIEQRSQLPADWLAQQIQTKFVTISHPSSDDDGSFVATFPNGTTQE